MSSPTPRSLRSRMGGVMRRTSSVLTLGRPSPPGSDAGSAKGVEAPSAVVAPPTPPTLVPPSAPTPGVPSPIAESPVREAAANAEEALSTNPLSVGPSPLSKEVVATPTTEEPTTIEPSRDIPSSSEEPTAEPPKEAPPAEQASTEPAQQPDDNPPRIFESATGPGAFTDEPEEMHNTQTEDSQSSVTEAVEPLHPKESENVEEDKGPSKDDAGTSHNEEVAAQSPEVPPGLQQPADIENAAPESITTMPVPVPAKETGEEGFVVEPSPSSQVTARPPGTEPAPTTEGTSSHEPTAAPTYDLDISGKEIWGPALSKPSTPQMTISSIRTLPLEDPFADPVPSAPPKITVTHDLPEPQPVTMPTPPVHQIKPSSSIPSMRSGAPSTARGHYEFDETRPLLSRPDSPQAYLTSPANPRHLNVSPGSAGAGISFPSASAWQATSGSRPRLHDLGWLEYILPDAAVYFVHPTMRVTTDVDLRQNKNLEAVVAYFDRRKDSGDINVGSGMELWLREVPKSSKKRKGDWFMRSWIDHRKRSVILDTFWEGDSRGPRRGKKVEEDALDSEYRYWLFMEAHPAHVALPHNARSQAMDVLSWSWADRLLPTQRAITAPFTQDECQELMNLLRSFGDTPSEAGIQPILHTRIVSRILLRAVQWRQMHFRPEKPLPEDAVQPIRGRPVQRPPLRRAFLDFIVSCFCLGIPYMFFNRTHQQRIDEESGLRNAGPLLVIGACTCLMAAIVLSASVTFLSLPGLDNISRVVGFVAIILASFSMASTLVAIFEYKADLERSVSVVGGEGLMMISRRNVIMSLPMVFLAYAVMAFVAGIALYSFRGVTLKDKDMFEQRFEDYTRWTVIGVIGGLAGILCTSALILRR